LQNCARFHFSLWCIARHVLLERGPRICDYTQQFQKIEM